MTSVNFVLKYCRAASAALLVYFVRQCPPRNGRERVRQATLRWRLHRRSVAREIEQANHARCRLAVLQNRRRHANYSASRDVGSGQLEALVRSECRELWPALEPRIWTLGDAADAGSIADGVVASSFVLKFDGFHMLDPSTARISIRCRITPGPHLGRLCMKLKTEGRCVRYRGQPGSAWATASLVSDDTWKALKFGREFALSFGLLLSRTGCEVEAQLQGKRGWFHIGGSPLALSGDALMECVSGLIEEVGQCSTPASVTAEHGKHHADVEVDVAIRKLQETLKECLSTE